MRVDSLAFRLFATAAIWTLLVLPLFGVLIHSLYRADLERGFDRRLDVLLTVVAADSIDRGGGKEPGHPRDVGEPLFELIHSGWYWQITPVLPPEGQRRVSGSLASERLKLPSEEGVTPDEKGTRWTELAGPLGEPLRAAEQLYDVGEEGETKRYSFMVAGGVAEIERSVASFRARLGIALALAGLGLLAVTAFQVRFGLLPLRAIERGLADIRSGDKSRLEGGLPAEIEPLRDELNALITSNQEIIERARTQVGNLAHALKTPLAVITNEAGDDKGPFAAKVAEQAKVMRDQINHYLDRARMAASAGVIGRAAEVRPVLEPLVRALERIYRDKEVRIHLECPPGLRFQGEKQDLEEMLGNLVDNACKWAKQNVYLTAAEQPGEGRTAPRRLRISVEDDGPGLSAEQLARIGKRGMRLDETKPGSGLGLSIVADIAQTYRGRMMLERSAKGGLSASLDLPAV
jgi:signal transduction histidine kinase